jgi:glycosyltransferase involved in cell wall biosynthesis
VYDNNSRDGTREAALAAGAVVRTETLQGKGHVVRRMFADIEADAYLLVDGDDTYDASAGPEMVRQLLEDRLDMVTGVRVTDATTAYRKGHRFGNAMLTGMVRQIFGNRITDMLSGYRAFSRRFVKSFPALARGFETETEISIHALELAMPVGEVVTSYGARPEGSESKLSTYRDGWRIMRTILHLFRIERPVLFYGGFGLFLAAVAITMSVPLAITFIETGLVPRFPTAILATGLMIVAFMSFMCGLILDTVVRGRREVRRLHYLALPAPGAGERPAAR